MELRRAGGIAALSCYAHAKPPKDIALEQIGRCETGVFEAGAAEIVAYDANPRQLFVINADANTVDILDLSDPTAPAKVTTIDVSSDVPGSGSTTIYRIVKD